MIKQQRHRRIMAILASEGVINTATLAEAIPEVSRITLRRDIAELADVGALKRTHGGAVLPDAQVLAAPGRADPQPPQAPSSTVDELDAIVLPPIMGRGADALRRQIVRRGIPFIAESAPQSGGCYLGPDNPTAARELGDLAGRNSRGSDDVGVLIIGVPDLENTRQRVTGFEEGFQAGFGGDATFLKANGQGSYRVAYRVALDALQANRTISVVFGVNDHSALAAMDAAAHLGRSVAAYATGGELPDFVARVATRDSLRAVAAFFPAMVGEQAIDAALDALAGTELPDRIITSHAVITHENLDDFYVQTPTGWVQRPDLRDAPSHDGSGVRTRTCRIGFLPHFPAHDWYRIMMQSMRRRAETVGAELVVIPPHHGIAREILRLRREIADVAVARINPSDTIILGEGEATLCLADRLRRGAFDGDANLRGLTVVTNALDVLDRLAAAPAIKTILTSGEYQAADRCLVGPSLGALFERMRADTAFLSVSGVSPRFGISSVNERLALAGSRFAAAARRTVALADHTLVGADANHRIARIDNVAEVITDDGTLPADRQSLRAVGVDVIIAPEEGGSDAPQAPRPLQIHRGTA